MSECYRLEWSCGHEWRGSDKSSSPDENDPTGPDCKGSKQPVIFSTNSTIADKSNDDFFQAPWCCSPQCCQKSIKDLEIEHEEAQTQYANVRDHRGLSQAKKNARESLRNKARYAPTKCSKAVNRHVHLCTQAFVDGVFMSNSMRASNCATGEIAPGRTNDRTLLIDPSTLSSLGPSAEVIETFRKIYTSALPAQSINKDVEPLEQCRHVKDAIVSWIKAQRMSQSDAPSEDRTYWQLLADAQQQLYLPDYSRIAHTSGQLKTAATQHRSRLLKIKQDADNSQQRLGMSRWAAIRGEVKFKCQDLSEWGQKMQEEAKKIEHLAQQTNAQPADVSEQHSTRRLRPKNDAAHNATQISAQSSGPHPAAEAVATVVARASGDERTLAKTRNIESEDRKVLKRAASLDAALEASKDGSVASVNKLIRALKATEKQIKTLKPLLEIGHLPRFVQETCYIERQIFYVRFQEQLQNIQRTIEDRCSDSSQSAGRSRLQKIIGMIPEIASVNDAEYQARSEWMGMQNADKQREIEERFTLQLEQQQS